MNQALQRAPPVVGACLRLPLSTFARGYGGTGKAVLVEEGKCLGTLIDYVQLNPYRAGLVSVAEGLERYRWSSLPDYTLPPR